MTLAERITFAVTAGVASGAVVYAVQLAAWAGCRTAVALVRVCRRSR